MAGALDTDSRMRRTLRACWCCWEAEETKGLSSHTALARWNASVASWAWPRILEVKRSARLPCVIAHGPPSALTLHLCPSSADRDQRGPATLQPHCSDRVFPPVDSLPTFPLDLPVVRLPVRPNLASAGSRHRSQSPTRVLRLRKGPREAVEPRTVFVARTARLAPSNTTCRPKSGP